jgi:aspartate ammonia-lyase
MNMNEVISNLGEERLGGVRGAYTIVRPLDHVNRSQSTNDVYPTALALATLEVGHRALERFAVLEMALRDAAGAAPDVERLGRTCLQDAVPVPVSAGLTACAAGMARASAGLAAALTHLLSVPLGATAVGSGIGAPPGFADHAVAALAELVGLPLRPVDDPFDALQNADPFLAVASELSRLWVIVAKLAADLRLLSSGPIGGIGEITLPAVQAGSSIMPGKVNPVIPELVLLVGYEVSGARTVVEHAARGGELELNVMETAIAASLLPALEKSGRCAALFAERCVSGVTWNEERISANLEGSLGDRVLRAAGSGHDADARLA